MRAEGGPLFAKIGSTGVLPSGSDSEPRGASSFAHAAALSGTHWS